MIKKILSFFFILQKKEVTEGNVVWNRHRLNPYNPLSYFTIIIVFIIAIILFGVVGWKEQVDTRNPFKFQ